MPNEEGIYSQKGIYSKKYALLLYLCTIQKIYRGCFVFMSSGQRNGEVAITPDTPSPCGKCNWCTYPDNANKAGYKCRNV